MIILLKREREGEREGERKKKEGGETRALSVPNIRFNSRSGWLDPRATNGCVTLAMAVK